MNIPLKVIPRCAYNIELLMRFREHVGIFGVQCLGCKAEIGGKPAKDICPFYGPLDWPWNPKEVAMLKEDGNDA